MWARRVAAPLIGGASACALMALSSRPSAVHAAAPASLEATTADWKQKPAAVLWPKVGSILKRVVFAREPEIPEWERKLALERGLRRRDEMSRMAKSSSDGCLMVNPPRVYVHASVAEQHTAGAAPPSEAAAAAPSAEDQTTFAVWHFGNDAVGHPGVVHGGAISMAVDESCGFAFFALGRGVGFTAYLHVNYRQPLPAETPILITVRPSKIDGRKVTLAASVTDGADKVFADGEALFVQPRSSKL
eukprot:Tamp_03157.p3 GENE.Tamp_03157~~Tamp_03157.p3  ORF type:complete len:246 (+),score=46.94 Tamp_03157:30-767(+)